MTHPVADVKSGQIQAQSATPDPAVASIPTSTPNPPPEPPRPPSAHHVHHRTGVLHAMQSLLQLIIIAIFIITFCAQPFRIPSESMESTLLVGDFLLVDKQVASTTSDSSEGPLPSATIHRGDIIVFHDPVDSTLHLVKRVIGLPGDHLRLHSGQVFINGHALTEPYAVYRPSPPDNFRDNFPRFQSADPEIDSHWWIRMRSLIDNGELIIPIGNYFVMGDNRNDSEDSRYWGFVPRDAIVGNPILIYFSLQQNGDGNGIAYAQPSAATPLRRRHSTPVDALADFARWGRILQIVK